MLTSHSDHLRREIMLVVKANNLPVTGELWLTLIFRTEEELVQICRDLHINVTKTATNNTQEEPCHSANPK